MHNLKEMQLIHLKQLQTHSFKRRWGAPSSDQNSRFRVAFTAMREMLGRKYAVRDLKARYFNLWKSTGEKANKGVKLMRTYLKSIKKS